MARNGPGGSRRPSQRTSKCRCGPVARPLCPADPIRAHFTTGRPARGARGVQMGVQGREPQPVADDDVGAQGGTGPHRIDDPALGGAHRAAARRREVDPLVHFQGQRIRGLRPPAQKVARGDRSLCRPHVRRDRQIERQQQQCDAQQPSVPAARRRQSVRRMFRPQPPHVPGRYQSPGSGPPSGSYGQLLRGISDG